MKIKLAGLLTIMLSFNALAGEPSYLTAEQYADKHTRQLFGQMGDKIGVHIYDGPYDGETAPRVCVDENAKCCVDLTKPEGIEVGNERWSESSSKQIEQYIYYHAVRNVNALFYTPDPAAVRFKEWPEEMVRKLVRREVSLLKSGSKPMSLRIGYRDQAQAAYPLTKSHETSRVSIR